MNDCEAYEFYLDPAHLEIAGPGRKHPKDKLTRILSVRISPSLDSQIAAEAAREGHSAGSWVRHTLRVALMMKRRRERERERPSGLIEGATRRGEPKALGSSLGAIAWTRALRSQTCHTGCAGRTFSCPHLSIGNVTSASCGQCGPLAAAGS